jgi:hypothetical protein
LRQVVLHGRPHCIFVPTFNQGARRVK